MDEIGIWPIARVCDEKRCKNCLAGTVETQDGLQKVLEAIRDGKSPEDRTFEVGPFDMSRKEHPPANGSYLHWGGLCNQIYCYRSRCICDRFGFGL